MKIVEKDNYQIITTGKVRRMKVNQTDVFIN